MTWRFDRSSEIAHSLPRFPLYLCKTESPRPSPQGGCAEQTSPTPQWACHTSEHVALLLEASEMRGWGGICYGSKTELVLTDAVALDWPRLRFHPRFPLVLGPLGGGPFPALSTWQDPRQPFSGPLEASGIKTG